MNLTGQANRKVTNINHFLNFAERFRTNLANFNLDKIGERLFVRS